MKTITEKQIVQAFERFHDLKPQEAQGFMERLTKNQPAVLAYLMTLESCFEKDTPPEDDEGQLFFVGLAVLNVLIEQQPDRAMITLEEIEKAEEGNATLLEKLEEGPEMQIQTAFLRMTETYNQAPLFLFAMQLLLSEIANEDEIGDDLAIASIKLKTIIDCFDPPAPAKAPEKN